MQTKQNGSGSPRDIDYKRQMALQIRLRSSQKPYRYPRAINGGTAQLRRQNLRPVLNPKMQTAGYTLTHLNVEDGDLLRFVDRVPDAQVAPVLRHDDVTLGHPLDVAAERQQGCALLQPTRGRGTSGSSSRRGRKRPCGLWGFHNIQKPKLFFVPMTEFWQNKM